MSQGQRFRRRALRRGYKVDEVDVFLDRVEATLQGLPVEAPVTAQEVHDVVFRVRFGGYDEWQVDLHLDRVERQLAEIEERTGFAGRPEPRMAPPMREERVVGRPMTAPPGPPPPMPGGPPPPMPAGPPPMREERMPPPMPTRPVSPMGPPPGMPPGYPRYDEPTNARGTFDGFEPVRPKPDMTAEIRMGNHGPGMPPAGGGASGEMQRIDQLRRTFQPRRFGSGYDQSQVDRLFDRILSAMSSRGPVPVSEAELDPGQFNLVPGGYFEAEVDAALREVREILRRR